MATLPGGLSFNPAGGNTEDDQEQFGGSNSPFEQAVQLLSLQLPQGFAGPQGGTVGPGLRALLQLPRNRSFVRGFGRPRFGGAIPESVSSRISGRSAAPGGFGVGPVARPQPAPAPQSFAPQSFQRRQAAPVQSQGPRLQQALAGPQGAEIASRSQRTLSGGAPQRRATNQANLAAVGQRVSAPGGAGFTQPLSQAGQQNFVQSRNIARSGSAPTRTPNITSVSPELRRFLDSRR